jgi:ADP-ribose pyrophosphatase
MSLRAPRAGERTVIAQMFGRGLYKQPFYYSDGKGGEKEEIYSMWGYQKGFPSILIPITTTAEVIAIRQFRHGANGFVIETPGGLPKGTQLPEEVAERELLEETGYQAGSIIACSQVWFDPAAHNLMFTPLVGLDCVKVTEPSLDKTEVMETMLVPLDEWYGKIWSGEIIDAKTIALSLLMAPILKRHLHFSLC